MKKLFFLGLLLLLLCGCEKGTNFMDSHGDLVSFSDDSSNQKKLGPYPCNFDYSVDPTSLGAEMTSYLNDCKLIAAGCQIGGQYAGQTTVFCIESPCLAPTSANINSVLAAFGDIRDNPPAFCEPPASFCGEEGDVMKFAGVFVTQTSDGCPDGQYKFQLKLHYQCCNYPVESPWPPVKYETK